MKLPNYAIHFARPGETFDSIFREHFGFIAPSQRPLVLRTFCDDNGIYNEQLLFPKRTVFVRLDPFDIQALNQSQKRELGFYRQVIDGLPEELRVLAPVFHYTNLVLASSGPIANALHDAQQTLKAISHAYLEYKEAARLNPRDQRLFKSRYDRIRRDLLAKYEAKQGRWISRAFSRGFKPMHEINLRGRGRYYSENIRYRENSMITPLGDQIERFTKAKYLLRAGGVFYTGFHLNSICREALRLKDSDRHRANKVLVQAGSGIAGSFFTSAATVLVYFLAFGTTPKGWLAGIGIGLAGGLGGAGIGHKAGKLYDERGQAIDLIEDAYMGDGCEFLVNPVEATRSLSLP